MNKASFPFTLVIILLIGFSLGIVYKSTIIKPKTKPKTKQEVIFYAPAQYAYKRIYCARQDLVNTLNFEGKQGWNLIHVEANKNVMCIVMNKEYMEILN